MPLLIARPAAPSAIEIIQLPFTSETPSLAPLTQSQKVICTYALTTLRKMGITGDKLKNDLNDCTFRNYVTDEVIISDLTHTILACDIDNKMSITPLSISIKEDPTQLAAFNKAFRRSIKYDDPLAVQSGLLLVGWAAFNDTAFLITETERNEIACSPLTYALQKESFSAVHVLLERIMFERTSHRSTYVNPISAEDAEQILLNMEKFFEFTTIALEIPDININCTNAEGKTALDIAQDNGFEDLATLIVNEGGLNASDLPQDLMYEESEADNP